jgi:hypothetical protein
VAATMRSTFDGVIEALEERAATVGVSDAVKRHSGMHSIVFHAAMRFGNLVERECLPNLDVHLPAAI